MTFTLKLSEHCPGLAPNHRASTTYIENIDLNSPDIEGGSYFILEAWAEAALAPFFVLRQRYLPGPTSGFLPSYLFIAETKTLFVGAGSRASCYDLSVPEKKWTESPIACGFRTWNCHGDLIVLYADGQIAGYDHSGLDLWGAYVASGWFYELRGNQILLSQPIGPHDDFPEHKHKLFDISKGPLG